MDERDLADVLGLLVPDFDALWRSSFAGATALFWIVLMTFFIGFLFFVVRYYRRSKHDTAELKELIDGLKTEELLDSRERVRKKADNSQRSTVRNLWREFDESLVESPDGRALWNTLDAEHFFNSYSLAGRLAHNRLLAAVPALLTAIGVLGTFVGLSAGLNGLELTENTDQIAEGVGVLIAGASVAFLTSVWGVFLSLAANLLEKSLERQAIEKISALQTSVDALYKRHAPEQSLVRIMKASEDSRESMLVLHERIGSSLQEAISGISTELQESLRLAIDQAMRPAMEQLIETTTKQSTDVFESLVERFAESFSRIGDRQAERIDQASEHLQGSITQFAEAASAQREELAAQSAAFQQQLADLAALSEQQRSALVDSTRELLSAINVVTKQIEASGESLSQSATQLRVSAEAMEGASRLLGDQFAGSLEKMHTLTEQQESAASLFWEYMEKMRDVQVAITDASNALGKSADDARTGFLALDTHQTAFLESLRAQFAETTAALGEEVTKLDQVTAEWLTNYAEQVKTQVEERMNDWNTQSRDYAQHMLSTARALSEVVDEIQSSRAP